jgi:hypothetical protein
LIKEDTIQLWSASFNTEKEAMYKVGRIVSPSVEVGVDNVKADQ